MDESDNDKTCVPFASLGLSQLTSWDLGARCARVGRRESGGGLNMRNVIGRILSFAGATGLVLALGTTAVAVAAPGDGYASWNVDGARNAFSGSVELPLGFPTTSFVSDSRAVDVSGGASSWLPEGTPFADEFGQSQGRPYISIAPAANNAAFPSTTTFVFDEPAPAGTWGINLGDIDAETVTISATVGTRAATVTEIGLQDAYNYCDASPRASTCSGLPATGNVVPTVSDDGTTITVADLACPTDPDRCNTTGEALWLMPTAELSSLTVTSAWKRGIPALQVWFATLADRIDGTILANCAGALPGAVELTVDGENVVATASVTSTGSFAFDNVIQRDDYLLQAASATTPPGVVVSTAGGDLTVPGSADLTATASFTVSGTVAGPADLIAGRVVRLTGGSVAEETTTDVNGAYAFPGILPGRGGAGRALTSGTG